MESQKDVKREKVLTIPASFSSVRDIEETIEILKGAAKALECYQSLLTLELTKYTLFGVSDVKSIAKEVGDCTDYINLLKISARFIEKKLTDAKVTPNEMQ